MTTKQDSSTDVNVYDGKVSVGPSDDLKKKLAAQKPRGPELGEGEVAGPEEVPGPYEVSLEQWKMIIAGQKISVRADGMFSQEDIDMAAALEDAFVKKNQELDKKLGQGQ